MSNLKQHPLSPDNFARRDNRVEHIRKAKDRKFYGFTHDQAGMHPLSIALDIFQKDGNRLGVYYLEIASPVRFNQGGGVQRASISFNTPTLLITIEGKNLVSVYEYLLEQRLVWLKEKDSSFAEVKENEPLIENIKIEER